jgi:hypothetical protein
MGVGIMNAIQWSAIGKTIPLSRGLPGNQDRNVPAWISCPPQPPDLYSSGTGAGTGPHIALHDGFQGNSFLYYYRNGASVSHLLFQACHLGRVSLFLFWAFPSKC